MTRDGLLGLGSNVGDRRVAAAGGRRRACRDAGVRPLASSSTYDTDPVGEVLDQPSFLNACVRVDDRARAARAARRGQAPRARARSRGGGVRHGPRAIDIDVLLLGDIELHARAHDAAARAAAQPPLRADPGARARLRALRARRHGGCRTRSRRWHSRRACAGPGRRSSCPRSALGEPRSPLSVAARRARRRPCGGRPSWRARSSVAPLTPRPQTTHRRPSRIHVTTARRCTVSSR